MMGVERNEDGGVQDPFLTGHRLWLVVLGQCPPRFSSCYFEAETMAKEVVEVMSICSGSSSPGCLLEGLMLKLKLQYFGHLIQRVDSLKRP